MAQQHQFCRSYNGSQLLGPHNPGVSPAPVAQQSAWPQVLDESVKKLAHRQLSESATASDVGRWIVSSPAGLLVSDLVFVRSGVCG
jgi:hypothetical protein